MKFTPDLHFIHDPSFDEAARMNALFNRPEVKRDLSPFPLDGGRAGDGGGGTTSDVRQGDVSEPDQRPTASTPTPGPSPIEGEEG